MISHLSLSMQQRCSEESRKAGTICSTPKGEISWDTTQSETSPERHHTVSVNNGMCVSIHINPSIHHIGNGVACGILSSGHGSWSHVMSMSVWAGCVDFCEDGSDRTGNSFTVYTSYYMHMYRQQSLVTAYLGPLVVWPFWMDACSWTLVISRKLCSGANCDVGTPWFHAHRHWG